MDCLNKECNVYHDCEAFSGDDRSKCGEFKPLKAEKEPVAEVPCSVGLWRSIATAPKDMTEILGWREDAGVMLMRWTAPIDFLTESELAELGDETAEAEDWFYADFVTGGRMEGSEAPTHWMPLPEKP